MFAKLKQLLKNKVYKWIFIVFIVLISPILIAIAVVFYPIVIVLSLFFYFKKYTFKLNKLIVAALVCATLGVQVMAINSFPNSKYKTDDQTIVQNVSENKEISQTVKTESVKISPEIKPEPEIKEDPKQIKSKNETVEINQNQVIPSTIDNVTTISSENSKTSENSKELFLVTKVVDGDTLTIDKIGTIRLIGINTPETVDPRKTVECFGKEASDKAKELLSNKKVYLEYDESQGKTDKYNRTLAYVFREDGLHFNAEMIKTGYAYEYTYDKPYKYQNDFKQAQKEAQNKQAGLWSVNTCSGQLDSVKATKEEFKMPVVTENKVNTGNQIATPTIPKSIAEVVTETQNLGEPNVKKSKSGNICHDKNSQYYYQTKKYTSFNTIEECLNSGGRLPAR
jgi:micrococcal nuclease